jgi:hypothetical protein
LTVLGSSRLAAVLGAFAAFQTAFASLLAHETTAEDCQAAGETTAVLLRFGSYVELVSQFATACSRIVTYEVLAGRVLVGIP